MAIPHHRLPLNLPHAGTVADRICMVLHQTAARHPAAHATAFETAEALRDLLAPFRKDEANPPLAQAAELRDQAAELGRVLVREIKLHKLGHDRLGQCVRNLFECLELGEEGAELSLAAGEKPHGVLRPHARKVRPMHESGLPETQPVEKRGMPLRKVADHELRIDVHLEPPGPIGAPEEGELGPPLDDAGDLDLPPIPQPKKRGAINPHKLIAPEDAADDWTFGEE